MTRRIALAILLTVWAMLIAGGTTAYLIVRWALVRNLDDSIVAKASSTAGLARAVRGGDPTTRPGGVSSRQADRVIIKNAAGQTLNFTTRDVFISEPTPVAAYFSRLADGTRIRTMILEASPPGPEGRPAPITIIYDTPSEQVDRLLDRLTLTFAGFAVVAGLVTALVAIRVSRTALRPLYETAQVISGIDPRSLDQRIDVARLPPELLPMATRLNEMLDRIEHAYAQRQQFLADASHELRTPVAALVTTAEVALRRPREAEHYRRTLESCLSDARLLRQLVERLMEQCRADTLSHDETPEPVDLTPLLNQCADQAGALGEPLGVTLIREIPPSFTWKTQPQRLRSVVTNLLANAVEHNRPGGTVSLVAEPNGQVLHLCIRDTGPGIAPEHIPHLFQPFYRADKARSHEAGHMGLGLSLVQAHVRAMNGTVRVESTLGVGTAFHVDLPAII